MSSNRQKNKVCNESGKVIRDALLKRHINSKHMDMLIMSMDTILRVTKRKDKALLRQQLQYSECSVSKEISIKIPSMQLMCYYVAQIVKYSGTFL